MIRTQQLITSQHSSSSVKILSGIMLFLLILALFIPGHEFIAEGQARWVFTDVGQGIMPSLALDPQGNPHVTFIRIGENGWVRYASLQNSQWQISQIASGDLYGPPSIAVDEQGRPHIVWLDHDSPDEIVYPGNERCLSVIVCKPSPGGNAIHAFLVNGEWVRDDITYPGHDGWDATVVIGKDGVPRVAAVEPDLFNNPSPGIEYAEQKTAGKWEVLHVDSLEGENYSHGTSIALDSRDRPYIAYFDDSRRDLRIAILRDGEWIIDVVDSQGDAGRFPNIVMDRRGNPTVAYLELITSTTGWVKVASKTQTGWVTERVDQLDNLFLQAFSVDPRGARNIISVAFDSRNIPHIVYSDEAVLKHATKQGEVWKVETILRSEEGIFGQTTSLEIDSNNRLNLVFVQAPTKNPVQSQWNVRYGTTHVNTNGSFFESNFTFQLAVLVVAAFSGIFIFHKASRRRKVK